jgi:zinc transport system substrate-binding protein
VICSDQQAEALRWFGLKVIGTYGRPEDFNPSSMHKLVGLGRNGKARLVIDNLQSGPDAGKELAHELGAVHVVLSNFPGGFNGAPTWAKTVHVNLERIIDALGRNNGR